MTEENDYAKSWRPEAGEELGGRVISLDTGSSDYGAYPILTIEGEGPMRFRTKDEGIVEESQASVHCVHSILRREIARKYEPTQIVGSEIRIKYLGLQSTKDGKTQFHNYKVFGGNRQALYDWNQDLPEDERPSATAGGFGASSVPAPASHAPLTQEDLGGPLPAQPSRSDQMQQQAADKWPDPGF